MDHITHTAQVINSAVVWANFYLFIIIFWNFMGKFLHANNKKIKNVNLEREGEHGNVDIDQPLK